jgi:hypothetical protein
MDSSNVHNVGKQIEVHELKHKSASEKVSLLVNHHPPCVIPAKVAVPHMKILS